MSAVRRLAAGEAPALAGIVRGLPEYFTDDVPGKVEHDAADHEAWVITADGTIAGFVIAARKSPGGAEILWIAVDAPRRGQGHGTRLLNNVMDDPRSTRCPAGRRATPRLSTRPRSALPGASRDGARLSPRPGAGGVRGQTRHSYDLVVTSLTKAQRDSLPPRP
jgi:GNAT superfamily N-acetyltransferase